MGVLGFFYNLHLKILDTEYIHQTLDPKPLGSNTIHLFHI